MAVEVLEAVTVCIGYGDFLAQVAPHNMGVLDRWLIVTSPDDTETREVCRRFSLPTLLTEDHVRNDQPFNKGRIIERGLQHLSSNGWRMHLDADIVLPSRTKNLLAAADIDQSKIYGCDRIMVRSYEKWREIVGKGLLSHDYHHLVRFPAGMEVGTRWVHSEMGYVPIGFLQLWHSSADQYNGVRNRPYPSRHNDACRTDVQHALQWDRRNRELLPELVVLHLESEAAPNGTNWKGRKTKRFGPAPVVQPQSKGVS